jgi:hypothetical protein
MELLYCASCIAAKWENLAVNIKFKSKELVRKYMGVDASSFSIATDAVFQLAAGLGKYFLREELV